MFLFHLLDLWGHWQFSLLCSKPSQTGEQTDHCVSVKTLNCRLPQGILQWPFWIKEMSTDVKVTCMGRCASWHPSPSTSFKEYFYFKKQEEDCCLVTLRRPYDDISKSYYHLKCPHASALTTVYVFCHIHVKEYNTSEVTTGKGNSNDEWRVQQFWKSPEHAHRSDRQCDCAYTTSLLCLSEW